MLINMQIETNIIHSSKIETKSKITDFEKNTLLGFGSPNMEIKNVCM